MLNKFFKKYKIYAFLLAAVFGIFLFYAPFASALEASYPTITHPALSSPVDVTPSTSLAGYIKYAFVFLLAGMGIIAVLVIVINSARIMISGGDAAKVATARENVIGSILGILLLISSVMILRTINPELVQEENVSSSQKPTVQIVGREVDWADFDNGGTLWRDPATGESWWYILGDYDFDNPWTINEDVPDVYESITSYIGWKDALLFYKCPPSGNQSDILVWVYDKKNFEFNVSNNNAFNVNTYTLECSSAGSILVDDALRRDNYSTYNLYNTYPAIQIGASDATKPIYSFRFEYESPGVYYFQKDACGGIRSYPVQRTNGQLPKFSSDNPTTSPWSLLIKNGTKRNERYGVVLVAPNISNQSDPGECSVPMTRRGCFTIDHNLFNFSSITGKISSAYILKTFPQEDLARHNLGDVVLRSASFERILTEDWFRTNTRRYPWYPVDANESERKQAFSNLSDLLIVGGRALKQDILPNECLEDKTCVRSILFKPKNYYVILYATKRGSIGKQEVASNGSFVAPAPLDLRCEVFDKPIRNLPLNELINPDSDRDLYKMYIVPSGENL